MADIPDRLRNRLLLIGVGSVAAGIYLAVTTELWIGLLVGAVCLSNPVFAWFFASRHERSK
ncbi:MAG: hypothetical protein ACOYXM_00935 [Actinomycetota bacterium]